MLKLVVVMINQWFMVNQCFAVDSMVIISIFTWIIHGYHHHGDLNNVTGGGAGGESSYPTGTASPPMVQLRFEAVWMSRNGATPWISMVPSHHQLPTSYEGSQG